MSFSCNILSCWAQLVSVFSRIFKFSRIVIYRAISRRSGLEWGDLLILCNRNNCALSVGVFSFSLICESIAAQFLTFVLHGEQTLVEKDSPSSRTTKSSFSVGWPTLVSFPLFLVGPTNTFSELIHPLLKLPNYVLKFYNLSEALGSFGLTPSSIRHRLCWRSATSTHFSSSTIYTTYKFTIYTTIHREATLKTALELLDTAEDSKPSADNNTRYSPSKSIT